MNGIDNLTLYKTVDELQESKNSIERRTGIDFSKNVQQFDLLLDIIGEETPETEEKRQVEVVEQILEAVWPKNLFEACGMNTTYKLLKSGKIKAMRIGRVWKIPKRAVQEYIVQEAHMKATGW